MWEGGRCFCAQFSVCSNVEPFHFDMAYAWVAVAGCARVARLLQADPVAVPHFRAQGCVFDAKRLTGRKFADPILQSGARLWPFKEIPGVVIQVAGEEKKSASREGSSVILAKMKGPLRRLHGTPKTLSVGTKFDVLTDPHVEFEPAVEVRNFRCFAL